MARSNKLFSILLGSCLSLTLFNFAFAGEDSGKEVAEQTGQVDSAAQATRSEEHTTPPVNGQTATAAVAPLKGKQGSFVMRHISFEADKK